MRKDIKIHTPVVWVEVMRSYIDDRGKNVYENEHLLWDGELLSFAEKRQNAEYIYFERYERFIQTKKIQDFGLSGVQKTKKVEEIKPFSRTFEERVSIIRIVSRTKITKIMIGKFVGYFDKNL